VLVEWLGGEILPGSGACQRANRYAVRFRGPDRMIFEVAHEPAAAGRRAA